jgi:Zn-finger nucleic acid-binding protein
MKCPVCKEPDLVIAERQGIEIDYCPSCRGVWLDRGELDKLIEKSTSGSQPRRDPEWREPREYSGRPQGHYKKPKSWLREIFD